MQVLGLKRTGREIASCQHVRSGAVSCWEVAYQQRTGFCHECRKGYGVCVASKTPGKMV